MATAALARRPGRHGPHPRPQLAAALTQLAPRLRALDARPLVGRRRRMAPRAAWVRWVACGVGGGPLYDASWRLGLVCTFHFWCWYPASVASWVGGFSGLEVRVVYW
eukprot:scaffold85345_cov54-Phaeocystis_antarctica.AAC.2